MIRLYHYESAVRVLGPGSRFVLWFQGCTFDCPGCIASESHPLDGGQSVKITDLAEMIISQKEIEGMTVSGGEPFLQSKQLLSLIEHVKKYRPKLSVMIFTGYTYESLYKQGNPCVVGILRHTDILVDGRYMEKLRCDDAWRGSSNQVIHFLTNRYGVQDYLEAQGKGVEIHLQDKEMFIAGIPPRDFNKNFDNFLEQKGIAYERKKTW
jgi:anaerobic ribonucleoside-triphosphate reductase activating protein